MMSFPSDWYWLADDGRVFASARQATVDKTDAGFLAFVGADEVPSDWPRDLTGAQTETALQDVLTQHGLWISVAAQLTAYANVKQWALATGGYTMTLSGQVRTFATDDISRGLMTDKFVRLTQPNPPTTMSWQFATGFEDITAADFAKAALAAGDFVQATFDALRPILAAIEAGTITATAQVDAAAWPSATLT